MESLELKWKLRMHILNKNWKNYKINIKINCNNINQILKTFNKKIIN